MIEQGPEGFKRKPEMKAISRRESEILQLASKGLRTKEIAVCLNISESTVETHKVNIFRKLGVENMTAAVAVSLRSGTIL